MASFRCYDSSDVIAILIITNFPLYLIQLWWQFFPNACLLRRSLCSNLAGIDSEKLYRATFICQYGLFCCMALVSFRLFCKNLGNLQEFFGQMDYRPPSKKLPVRLWSGQIGQLNSQWKSTRSADLKLVAWLHSELYSTQSYYLYFAFHF